MEAFLAGAGWGDAQVEPIPGDASARRFFRLRRNATPPESAPTSVTGPTAMLMHSPPPDEDPRPFLQVAAWLSRNGLRAPAILAEDAGAGWVLAEDLGDVRMREWIDANPEGEHAAYAAAIETLAQLHRRPPGPFASYDMATYLREARLLTEWFAPAHGLDTDVAGYEAAWNEVLSPVIARTASRPVTVLRDYHAENIMLLAKDGSEDHDPATQGLIDFQDALIGHPAYDLVSLLQDARRDVSPQLEAAMLELYGKQIGVDETFGADYAVLGTQRNAKIVGIFTRLHKRDGKPRYLAMIPRVWRALERDLAHPALAPVARWFDANIPHGLRASGGGTIA